MKTSPPDINSLISAAQDEAVRQEYLAPTSQNSKPSAAKTLLMSGAAVAGLVFAAVQLGPLARTHSADQALRDLDAIIDQARDLVEATRTAQGRLPDALPNAALAGVVAYTPAGNAYQLFAASGSFAVKLDPDGKKTFSKGNGP